MDELTKQIKLLSPYIPYSIIKRLNSKKGHHFKRIESLTGVVLFFDVSGFTRITQSLEKSGDRGAELLQELLSKYYSDVIQIIRKYGGIVYQFAGDSVLCAFSQFENESSEKCAERSVVCSFEIQKELEKYFEYEVKENKLSLVAKIALSFGKYYQIILGKQEYSFSSTIVGYPVETSAHMEALAKGKDIIVDQSLWDLLPSNKKSSIEKRFYKLKNFEINISIPNLNYNMESEEMSHKLGNRCSKFIVPELYRKIIGGYHGFVGDFREVTCLFLRFDGLNYINDTKNAVSNLNKVYSFVQETSEVYSGVLVQTDLTDKGNVFLVLFGAPTAQENKEVLAARFATRALEEKAEMPFIKNIQMGIATGFSYCGDLGAPFRKGYTVVGETINFASRLMTYADGDHIHIDNRTEPKLRKQFVLKKIENIKLKGIEKEVSFFNIESQIERFRGLMIEYKDDLIGRKEELKKLVSLLEKSIKSEGQVCTITGEAGIGKSRITGAFLNRLSDYDVEPLVGYCFSYEKFTPFFPWKDLLSLFFQIFDADPKEEKILKIFTEFEKLEDVSVEWVRVLAKIIGVKVEEDIFTRNLDPRQKNQRIFEIIFQLIEKKSEQFPLLLFFDDTHWSDDISLELIKYIASRISSIPAMLLLVMRPNDNLDSLKDLSNYSSVDLEEFSKEESRYFLRNRLNLKEDNVDFENKILVQSQGNPFFLESTVFSLREKGYIVKLDDDKYEVSNLAEDLQIPNSLQDVVLSRIDRLKEPEQVVVKTAAVIGRVFQYETLLDLLPIAIQEELNDLLTNLKDLELTPLETEDPLAFIFKHIIIRDVAYNSLLTSTRNSLHLKVAELLENTSKDNLIESADILAFHFIAGENKEKGLKYTLMSAEKAKFQYANKNAIYHYRKALELLADKENPANKEIFYKVNKELAQVMRQQGDHKEAIALFNDCYKIAPNKLEKATIRMGIGQCYQETGDVLRAAKELEIALKMAGNNPPGNLVSTILHLVKEIIIQVIHLKFKSFIGKASEKKKPYYKLRSTILIILQKIYFFISVEKVAWAGFAHINLAERLRDDYDLCLANSNYSTILQALGFLESANDIMDVAMKESEKLNDPAVRGSTLVRYSFCGLYQNDPPMAYKYSRQAADLFKQIGDLWELIMALTIEGVSYAYASEFAASRRVMKELRLVADRLNSKMHKGWAIGRIAFYDYLMGKSLAGPVEHELNIAVNYAKESDDLIGEITALVYLGKLLQVENKVEEAAAVAIQTMNVTLKYKVIVPHAQMAFIDAAETALFCLEEEKIQNVNIPVKKLKKIVKKGIAKGLKLGKTFSYLYGPALRIKARYYAYLRKLKKAEKIFNLAIQVLEGGPNKWETGLAFVDAGVVIKNKQDEYFDKAEKIFKEFGLELELQKLEKLRTK